MFRQNAISFSQNKKRWLIHKTKTFFNHFQVYLIASIPGLFAFFGFFADFLGVFRIVPNPSSLFKLLLIFLFVYGLANLYILYLYQKSQIRLNRQQKVAEVMNKEILESFKNYLAYKRNKKNKNGTILDEGEIIKHIEIMLDKFNDNYVKLIHRDQVCLTLKYFYKKKLYSIRRGYTKGRKIDSYELFDKSFVFQILSESVDTIDMAYVHDLDNPSNYELKTFGISRLKEIRKRSMGKYNTFVAIPIRSGIASNDTNEIKTFSYSGFLGMDLKESYGFGNIDTNKHYIMASFTDLLSEPVLDLINTKK